MAFRSIQVAVPTFATPTGTVDIGDTAVSGAGPFAASSAHRHAFPVPSPSVWELGGTIDLSGYYARKPVVGDGHQYVSTNGNNANDGLSPGAAKLTVAAAIAALPAGGGIVEILAGTFSVAATINAHTNNVRIVGDGAATVLTAANGLNAPVLDVRGSDIVIENLLIDGNLAGQTVGSVTAHGIYATALTNSVIRYVTAKNCRGHGILLDNAGGAWSNVAVRRCRGANNGDTTNLGNGITVVAGNRAVVDGCIGESNVGDGIYTQSLADSIVSLNVCQLNSGYGIELTTSINGCTFTGNVCRGNVESGIGADAIADMAANTFAANICELNGGSGIQLFSGSGNPTHNVIIGNVCRNNSQPGLTRVDLGVAGQLTLTNTRDGIELSGVTRATIVGNACFDDQGTKTQRYGINDGGGATAALVAGNDVPDNATGGIHLTGTGNVVGTNNVTATSPGGVHLQQSTSPGGPAVYSDDGSRVIIESAAGVAQLLLRIAGASNNNGVLIATGAAGARMHLMGAAGEIDAYLERTAPGIVQANGKLAAAAGLGVGNSAAATTPGAVTHKIEVFDAAGASLGFLPVYDAIT